MRLTTWLVLGSLFTGCHQLDDAAITGQHDLSELKARGEYVSTNAREYTISGRAHVPAVPSLNELTGEARDETIQKAVDRHLMTGPFHPSHIDQTFMPSTTAFQARKRNISPIFAGASGRPKTCGCCLMAESHSISSSTLWAVFIS